MLLTNRFGVVASSSIRVQFTELAGSASALDEMNTRPVVGAAQAGDVFDGCRSTLATPPPARLPQKAEVSRLAPSSTQSPQVTEKSPVHSLQCWFASASVIEPSPNVFVR